MPCFGKPKREDERCAGQRYDGTKGEETYMYMYIFTYIYIQLFWLKLSSSQIRCVRKAMVCETQRVDSFGSMIGACGLDHKPRRLLLPPQWQTPPCSSKNDEDFHLFRTSESSNEISDTTSIANSVGCPLEHRDSVDYKACRMRVRETPCSRHRNRPGVHSISS